MACSKLSPKQMLNNTEWSKKIEITIPEDEIKMFCYYEQESATSIDLIKHLLGGKNMNYEAMNLEDSFQCFEFCASEMMEILKTTKQEILFFEHRKCSTSNIMVVVTKQDKSRGVRLHPILKAVVRFTITVTPNVGFCRYLNVKGTYLFYIFQQKNCY